MVEPVLLVVASVGSSPWFDVLVALAGGGILTAVVSLVMLRPNKDNITVLTMKEGLVEVRTQRTEAQAALKTKAAELRAERAELDKARAEGEHYLDVIGQQAQRIAELMISLDALRRNRGLDDSVDEHDRGRPTPSD